MTSLINALAFVAIVVILMKGSEAGKKIKPEVVCSMDAEEGLCRGALVRYFFNSTTSSCEEFTYGGCGGNANNFEYIESCRAICGSNIDTTPNDVDVCSMEAQRGPCKAAEPRYFYNSETSSCEQFIYGGCEGNANNFKDSRSCRRACA